MNIDKNSKGQFIDFLKTQYRLMIDLESTNKIVNTEFCSPEDFVKAIFIASGLSIELEIAHFKQIKKLLIEKINNRAH